MVSWSCLKTQVLIRGREGQVDCLIDYEYAAFHPVRKQVTGHLLLLENGFGMLIWGRHPILVKEIKKVLQHKTVHHAMVRVNDLYKLEQLRVEFNPRCGSCKCEQCHPGRKHMTLKEEREYKIIKTNLSIRQIRRNGKQATRGSRILEHYQTTRVLPSLPWKPKRDISVKTQYTPQYIASKLKVWLKAVLPANWPKRTPMTTRDQWFFISHHEILKPESKTTPCHITFNSSANFWWHALNKNYAKGPDTLNNLLNEHLLRFREEGVAVIRDIQKMIHSINIPLLDQMTHCFLWRDLDDQKEPETLCDDCREHGRSPVRDHSNSSNSRNQQRWVPTLQWDYSEKYKNVATCIWMTSQKALRQEKEPWPWHLKPTKSLSVAVSELRDGPCLEKAG